MDQTITADTLSSWMQNAIQLAQKADSDVGKNPFVGCVIVSEKGFILGEGYHKQWGHNHAEINAIETAIAKGATKADFEKSTMYVTLEPCSHTGKTPPCTQKILELGIKKVVIGMKDPNNKVDGISTLEQNGVQVKVIDTQFEVNYLNRGFIAHNSQNRPWLIGKMAISIDGKIAMPSGESKWITNSESRCDVHKLRSKVGAIITGASTILADNPQLNVRGLASKSPDVYILSANSTQIPADSKVFTQKNRLVVQLEKQSLDTQLLKTIANQSNTNYLLLESGGELFSKFLHNDLFDELLIYQAPFFMGQGLSLTENYRLDNLQSTLKYQLAQTQRFGNDIKLSYIKTDSLNLINSHATR